MTGALSRRRVVPELLDGLDACDARAIRSRLDLFRINVLMFQSRIMASLLRRHVGAKPRRLLEIGSGDGTFMLSVARRLGAEWEDVDLVLLDRLNLVSPQTRAEFAARGWPVTTVTADVFDWTSTPACGSFDAVCANLFLHHFNDDALATLLSSLRRLAPILVATEPRRNSFALSACALLKLVGANDVTRHDAAVSVRAGFSGSELSDLCPASAARVEERAVGPFTHTFSVRFDAA